MKILVLPGWMKELQFYHPAKSPQIQFGTINPPISAEDVVIGMSLGALIVLRESARIPGKIVLVNPPLPHRSVFYWFMSLLRMIAVETPFNNRQKYTWNPLLLLVETVRCVKLLSIDFDPIIDAIPKDRLLVVRGKQDTFFADRKAATYLREKGITVIEVDSGHNWSEAIESTVLM